MSQTREGTCRVCGISTIGTICSSECDNALPSAPSEPVLWAVYDTHGRMMTYTEVLAKAESERARYEGYGDACWIANRPFTVVPLYTRPAPREGVTEAAILALQLIALLPHSSDGAIEAISTAEHILNVFSEEIAALAVSP